MALTFFTVIGDWKAIIPRPSLDQSTPDPALQAITGNLAFMPSTAQVFSQQDERMYNLTPFEGARIDNGVIKLVNGMPINTSIPAEQPGQPADHRRYGVRLAANTAALGPLDTLQYTVIFSNVVFNKRLQKIPQFTFTAPTSDTIIDLATVEHVKRIRVRT